MLKAILKDITSNHFVETREDDMYIITNLLVKESENLFDKLKELKNYI